MNLETMKTLYSVLAKHARCKSSPFPRYSRGIDWYKRIQSLPKTSKFKIVRKYLKDIHIKTEYNSETNMCTFKKDLIKYLYTVKSFINLQIMREVYKNQPKGEIIYDVIEHPYKNCKVIKKVFKNGDHLDMEHTTVNADIREDGVYKGSTRIKERMRVYLKTGVYTISKYVGQNHMSFHYKGNIYDLNMGIHMRRLMGCDIIKDYKMCEFLLKELNISYPYVQTDKYFNLFFYINMPYIINFAHRYEFLYEYLEYLKDIDWKKPEAFSVFVKKYHISKEYIKDEYSFYNIGIYYLKLLKMNVDYNFARYILSKIKNNYRNETDIFYFILENINMPADKIKALFKLDKIIFTDICSIFENLKDDLNKEEFQNLQVREMHDYLVREQKNIKDKYRSIIYKKDFKYKGIRPFTKDIYKFKLPRSNHEMIDFGNALSICVGSPYYFDNVRKNEMCIVFCFKENKPYACFEIYYTESKEAKLNQAKLQFNKPVSIDKQLSCVVNCLCTDFNIEKSTTDIT